MSEIYENATLTIIPSASLPDPAKRKVTDFWHDLPWCFGDDTTLTGQYTVSAADGEALEIWWGGKYRSEPLPFVNFLPGPDNFIWRSRGWTFQEELLSRRKLYLGNTRMQFICTKSRGIEDTLWLRKKQPLNVFTQHSSLLLTEAAGPDHVSTGDLNVGNLTAHQAYDFWYRTVNVYGDRILTYSTDTIVAIGGLAKRLVPILQGLQPSDDVEYVGGIWKADLLRGILWASSDIDGSGPVSLPCRSRLPARPAGASWLWSSFPLPITRKQQHIPDKRYRYRFLLEGQDTPACTTIASDCRMISWKLEPNSAPVFTPTTVHGEIEITGKMVELDCVWEFQVSPFDEFQPLALPAPLEGLQGYDESDLDPEGSAGIGVGFNWPFTDDPSTKLWDDAAINVGVDCQWTQAMHDNVSQGGFRVYAMLLAYGVMKHPSKFWGRKGIHRMSTMGLLLVPDDPKALTPNNFQRFGLFLFPGRPVAVSESGAALDATKARPCMHKAFRLAKTSTVVVH
jgi:hypothetical protein